MDLQPRVHWNRAESSPKQFAWREEVMKNERFGVGVLGGPLSFFFTKHCALKRKMFSAR